MAKTHGFDINDRLTREYDAFYQDPILAIPSRNQSFSTYRSHRNQSNFDDEVRR